MLAEIRPFFDHSQHKLTVDGLDTALDVLAFHGKEALSEPFSYQVEFTATARDLPHHAGMAAAYGLPHGVTLRALTLGAAEILGVADQVGSLEAGKLGNVIVTDGDPLEPSTSLHYLFIAGKPVALESKHSQLYRTYRQRLPSGSSGRE